MQEADNISLEIEEDENSSFIKEQLIQYNIYINFLNDYYSQKNPRAVRFDSQLSRNCLDKLYGEVMSSIKNLNAETFEKEISEVRFRC